MDDGERGYLILDRTRGRAMPVARADDAEMAARIVRLLNADAEAAARQGAVVP
jgi:hypothetical protein